MLLIIIWAAILILSVIYLKILKPLNCWKDRKIPYEKPWPIVGNMAPIAFRTMSMSDLILYWCNKNSDKSYFGIHQFFNPTLVIQDHELVKQIAVKHFDAFEDHHEFVPVESDPFWNKNLFTMTGQEWRDMRSVLSPVFTSSKMKGMFHLMVECAEKYIKSFGDLDQMITLEMKESYLKFTNDVIASTAFGIQLDTLDKVNDDFLAMATKAFDFEGLKAMKFFAYSISPWLSKVLGIKFFEDDVKEFFSGFVQKVLRQRDETGLVRPDMIHLMREAQKGRLKQDDDGHAAGSGFGIVEEYKRDTTLQNKKKIITDEDIAAQAIVFYFGGFDTVTVLMTHATYELATNPDVQSKLIEEVDKTLKECNGQITYNALMKMKYFDMVISETMRLWSAAVFTNRKATKSIVLNVPGTNEKLTIEKETSIWFPIFAMHRNPKIYKNPLKFDPERFSDENKQKIPSSAYIPFELGPILCIGNRFALLESKIILFFILSKFEIVPVEKTQIPLRLSRKTVFLTAEGGYWVGLKPRSRNPTSLTN